MGIILDYFEDIYQDIKKGREDYKQLSGEVFELVDSYHKGIMHQNFMISKTSGIKSIVMYEEFNGNFFEKRLQINPQDPSIGAESNIPLRGFRLNKRLNKIIKETITIN